MTLNELNVRANVLKKLCHELNPYQDICSEDLEKLASVGITTVDDPFHLTNILILYVEDTLEEISKRQKHLH